jgi:hypothetical protein
VRRRLSCKPDGSGGELVNDCPFIVLSEIKTSNLHIPVWARYSPLRTRVEAHALLQSPCEYALTMTSDVLVLVLHRGVVTVSSAGPRKLFKGMTTATSGVLARFPLLLPVRNSFASYGASAV